MPPFYLLAPCPAATELRTTVNPSRWELCTSRTRRCRRNPEIYTFQSMITEETQKKKLKPLNNSQRERGGSVKNRSTNTNRNKPNKKIQTRRRKEEKMNKRPPPWLVASSSYFSFFPSLPRVCQDPKIFGKKLQDTRTEEANLIFDERKWISSAIFLNPPLSWIPTTIFVFGLHCI